MLDKETLFLLKKVFTDTKHIDFDEITMSLSAKVPDILSALPEKELKKITREQAIELINNNKNNACLIGKTNKDYFVKAICDYLTDPDYKATIELKSKDIQDFIGLVKKTHFVINKPIFKITDTIAKQIFKTKKAERLALWQVLLSKHILKNQILKYWKYDMDSLQFLSVSAYTKEMVKAVATNKVGFYKVGQTIIDLYKKRPDIMSNKELAYAISKCYTQPSDITCENIPDQETFRIATLLSEYSHWAKFYSKSFITDTDQTYFDLCGIDNTDMIMSYLVDKLSKIKRTPAEQVYYDYE